MSAVEPRLVRQEIDELLTSGRLERLETVSAHIFQMYGREWKELTKYDILVHVFHDSLDDMDKLLARDRCKLVFDFVPLSASFTFTCLSRKFVRLSLNKFDRTAPAYGFGFSNLRQMETFCAHLDRIRNYARATLVPPVRSIALGMSSLGLHSPSSIAHRASIPYVYADDTLTERSASATSSIAHPYSLYRDQSHDYYSRIQYYNKPNSSTVFSEFDRYTAPCNGRISDEYTFIEPATAVPMCEVPDLTKEGQKRVRDPNSVDAEQSLSK
ncbi:hypothetical protein GCK32_004515, partial [Trichostrongylus colubriformis]